MSSNTIISNNIINYFTPHNIIIGLLIFIILLLIFKRDTFDTIPAQKYTQIVTLYTPYTTNLMESQKILDEIYKTVNNIDLMFDKYKRKPPSSTNKYAQYIQYVDTQCSTISGYISALNNSINSIDTKIKTYINPNYSTSMSKDTKSLNDLLIKIQLHHTLILNNNKNLISNIKKALLPPVNSSNMSSINSVQYLSTIKSTQIKQIHDQAIIYHKLKGDRQNLIDNFKLKAEIYDKKFVPELSFKDMLHTGAQSPNNLNPKLSFGDVLHTVAQSPNIELHAIAHN